MKPRITPVPLATGLAWSGGGPFRFEEKLDGVFKTLIYGPALLAGEMMRDGRFYAFDILSLGGAAVDRRPFIERLAMLEHVLKAENGKRKAETPLRPATGNGGEFLEFILARGGEGIVAKDLHSPYGVNWYKCKRSETLDLIVSDMDPDRGSVRLMDPTTGEDRGWCPARARFQDIKISDFIEVEVYGLTARGKLREPRFVRLRPDKFG